MFAVSLGDDGAELRPLEIWQAQEFLAHMDRARELVDPWIPFASFATDLESTRALLGRYAQKQATDTGRLYGIWLDGTLVGGVLFRIFDAESGNCEVGCWLEPAAQGRGLITRASRKLIDWAVYERGMHRVEWVASAANRRSIAVAERLGMKRDGVLRESYPYRGERHDSEIWSVLAPEWRARKD
ncbi:MULTISPECIES: GNAT family N-acetyltransferase [unclassified Streptomyces]|uniref:GNAT family N-acetyltransferase n=1 Tax=unclassified Streptomyces TaxID=2593676 RepID=UPI0011E86454|nr:GNAT family protein [Streptomyces sp. sk2.1]TXS67483.1 N-acetyltransferase [Streptomyces sp. sk2.1]